MPEDQKPFVHQDGPMSSLSLDRLHRQIEAIIASVGDGGEAVELLKLAIDPSMFTTIETCYGFDASCRALVADVCIALLASGKSRPRLMGELRQLLEKQP